jgi:PIN domain nuclease of toxin-antitoxin system
VKLLLDTHIFLWWLEDHPRLSATSREVIAQPDQKVFVSAASIWEMTTKHRLGRLPLPCAQPEDLPDLVLSQDMALMPMLPAHAARAGSWPQAHRDPFDRMLAAQAALESCTLATTDPALAQFNVPTLG